MKTCMDYFKMSEEELFNLFRRLLALVSKKEPSENERDKEIEYNQFCDSAGERLADSFKDAVLFIEEVSDHFYDYETLVAMDIGEFNELHRKAAMVDLLYDLGVEELDEDYDPEAVEDYIEKLDDAFLKSRMQYRDKHQDY